MRFVILQHSPPPEGNRAEHWDLLLDTGTALRTWALTAAPQAGASVLATPLADHRRVFLVYEGPLSGGRGSVTRWDGGTCEIVADAPDRVELQLNGGRIAGRLTLYFVAGKTA